MLIQMLHFRMCNILKFTENSLVVLIPYLLTYSQQCFVTTLLCHIVFMRNAFCFNGFNQTAIALCYFAHIKRRKTRVPLFWTTQYTNNLQLPNAFLRRFVADSVLHLPLPSQKNFISVQIP